MHSNSLELISTFVTRFEDDEDLFVVEHSTSRRALDALYDRLPFRLPALFEDLLLTYRWKNVYLYDVFRLLDNPPGRDDLSEFLEKVFDDEFLGPVCLAHGFIQFGFHYDRYDPLCFDSNGVDSPEKYEVVLLDHELVLQHEKMKKIAILASSFEDLIKRPYPQPPAAREAD